MSRWSRPVTGLAMTVLVTPLLMACGGGDDPAAEGTPTPKFSEATSSATSPDVSESASSSESADAKPKTPEQVARAYIAAVGAAINTGETAGFLKYTTSACSNCEVVAQNVRNIHKRGQSARSQGWSVATLKRDTARGDLVFLSGKIDAKRQVLLRRDGSVYKRETAAVLTQELRLKRHGDSWVITGWNLDQ